MKKLNPTLFIDPAETCVTNNGSILTDVTNASSTLASSTRPHANGEVNDIGISGSSSSSSSMYATLASCSVTFAFTYKFKNLVRLEVSHPPGL